MTNHPRYPAPPPQPGRRPADPRTAVYPGQHGNTGYQQNPYDWRYATQQQQQAYRQPYDPYRGGQPPGTSIYVLLPGRLLPTTRPADVVTQPVISVDNG